MAEVAVMRIVFRIGGSVVASPVNTELIGKYAGLLKVLKKQGKWKGLAAYYLIVADMLKIEV